MLIGVKRRQGATVLVTAMVASLVAVVAGAVAGGGDPEAEAELDRLWPVETPSGNGGEPAREVALGDSTMALADGEMADRHHGCRHEKGAWPELLGAANLSCSGAGARIVTKLTREVSELDTRTTRVYVTVGTNSFRAGMSTDEVRRATGVLVDVISDRAPTAEVVFVGYLSVHGDAECMSERDQRVAKHVDDLHARADEVMSEVASEKGVEWIDVSGAPYPVCDGKKTYVHGSKPESGTPWHSSRAGHRYVADKVREELGDR